MLVLLIGFATLTGVGRDLCSRFFQSLRIAKPTSVSVDVSAVSGGANREVLGVVAEMVADSGAVQQGAVDRTVPSPTAAMRLTGTPVLVPAARRDIPKVIITDARALTWPVNRARLATILSEAGEPQDLPPFLDGAAIRITVPTAIRLEYGHCPAPVAPTFQNQLQGPPPPPPDVADCVILFEAPVPSADVPAGVGPAELVSIALELSGMSPTQSAAFLSRIDWRATLTMSIPRFLRTVDTVDVKGAPGMLLSTGGRRGPAYELVWIDHARLFTLTGYGNPGAAVSLAGSLGTVRGAR